MRPTATFIDLIRSIDSGNVQFKLETLASLLRADPPADPRAAAIVRHLDTLGFKLEGSNRFGDAARAYELAASVDERDPHRWRMIITTARLRNFVERELWDDALAFTAAIRREGVEAALRKAASTLLSVGWDHECRYRAEHAVQCYRLAFTLNGGDSGLSTGDGQSISVKIRNLRLLQMNALAQAGRHEEAAALHESTRMIAELGPVGVYNIISARQAADEGRGIYRELLASRKMVEPEVRFLDSPITLTSQPGTLDAPPQYVALFKDCLTFPRSNVVLHGQRLIYDLAAHPLSELADIKDGVNPDQIMTAVWGPGRALIESPCDIREFDAGLMLFGFQSRQYGHWLLEFVPRLLSFNDHACPADFPICIDDHMPETHRQVIKLMDDRDRPVMALPPIPTRFRELGIAPVPTFFPFDTRPGLPTYDAIWPEDVLGAMRHKILERLAAKGVDLRQTGRRIILSRRGFVQRQLLNEVEITETLSRHGFEIVHPERLTFEEQVQLFNSADTIVGSASSALINCIFCRPGAKIIALTHDDRSFYFRNFTSIAKSSGAEISFMRGITLKQENIHPMHSNYTISPTKILSYLETITKDF